MLNHVKCMAGIVCIVTLTFDMFTFIYFPVVRVCSQSSNLVKKILIEEH